MYPTTKNLESFLTPQSSTRWEITSPLIFPEPLIGTIEEILYDQRAVPDFSIE